MKVLIVDDEQIAIDGIMMDVDFERHQITTVYTANSMRQAQEILQRESVDILMCDIEMPNGSGLDLVNWVNQQGIQIVKIILTCHSDFRFAQQAVRLQCLDYILKPAMPEDLEKVLEKAVRQVRQQDADGKVRRMGEQYVHHVAGNEKEEAGAVDKTVQYILAHVEEELTVEGLAARVYMSPNYLSRCFKKKYGKTVMEYITEHRLSLAEELLKNTNLSVTMISAKVGYPNYTYFTKQFKRFSGLTPSKFRERYGR